jgi:hypothetical protein
MLATAWTRGLHLPGALAAAVAAWPRDGAAARAVVRYLAHHTGLPALVVAALLVAVGYRVLRRSARLALEIAAIAAVLVAATELGWIRW